MMKQASLNRCCRLNSLLAVMILAVAMLLAACAGSLAATLTVAKDGSGQYSVIQDAVNAAADGDTVLIRAGVYEEVAPYDAYPGGWPPTVAIGVHQVGLTIRGEHRDSVIVRQAEFTGDAHGIVMRNPSASDLRVEELTLRNFDRGVSIAHDRATLDRLRIVNCNYGIRVCCYEASLELSNAVVDSCKWDGLHAHSGCQELSVRHSTFRDNAQFAIRLADVSSVVLEDVTTVGGAKGFSAVGRSDVVFRRCNTSGVLRSGIAIGRDVSAELYSCRLDGGEANIELDSNRALIGYGNELQGSTVTAIERARLMEAVDFKGNSILRGTGYLVTAVGYVAGTVDFSGNWWGTTEPDSVRAWVFDSTMDPWIDTTVIFEPMLMKSVRSSAKATSMLKVRYGQRRH